VPSRRESFDFIGLTPERFEELVFLLGALEIPSLVRTANPDGGLDALVPAGSSGEVPRGIQAKHHTKGPSATKCAESLRDAIAAHRPEHVTFAFPTNPTAGKIAAFDNKVVAMDPTVEVDFWGASQLTSRLIGSDGGRRVSRHIFGDEDTERLERLIRAHQDVDSGAQALEALGAGADLLDRDPYFLYSVGARPGELPAPPPAKGAVMRVEVSDEHGTRHIDAVARPGTGQDQLPQGKLMLEGEAAIERWQRFRSEGGEVTFEDVGFQFERLPKHLAPLWDGVERSDVVIRTGERPRRTILMEIDGDAGSFSAEVQLGPAAPKQGWEHAMAGSAGAAALTFNSRRRGDGGEARIDWTWHSGRGSSREQLQSLKFLRAASGKGTMRLMDPRSREVFTEGPTPDIAYDDDMAALTQVYEDVVSLERWLGTTIDVPDEILAGDANALRRIARLMEGIESSWTDASFVLDPGGPKEIETEGVFQLRRQMGVELFGREYQLGELATYIDGYHLDSSRTDGRKHRVRPHAARLVVEDARAAGASALVGRVSVIRRYRASM
jgi:hypothetical protein